MAALPDLADLVASLRDAGYRVGTREYLNANRLLLHLASTGGLSREPRRLASLLGPVFCASERDQADFPSHVENWLRAHSPEPTRGWTDRYGKYLGIVLVGAIFGFQIGQEYWPRDLTGSVTADGKPVAQAKARLLQRETVTDQEGKFTLRYRRTDLPQTLRVEHPDPEYPSASIAIDKETSGNVLVPFFKGSRPSGTPVPPQPSEPTEKPQGAPLQPVGDGGFSWEFFGQAFVYWIALPAFQMGLLVYLGMLLRRLISPEPLRGAGVHPAHARSSYWHSRRFGAIFARALPASLLVYCAEPLVVWPGNVGAEPYVSLLQRADTLATLGVGLALAAGAAVMSWREPVPAVDMALAAKSGELWNVAKESARRFLIILFHLAAAGMLVMTLLDTPFFLLAFGFGAVLGYLLDQVGADTEEKKQAPAKAVLRRRRGYGVIHELQSATAVAPELFGPALRRVVTGLRQPRDIDLTYFSMPDTVEASARRAGLFTPVHLYRRRVPEYLALIGRSGFQDHQSRWIDELLTRLERHGMVVERFYFANDPRVVRRGAETGRGIVLDELAPAFPRHTVLVFAETRMGFNAVTNAVEPWARQVLDGWARRVFFSYERPYHWTRREWQLGECGFIVLPAGADGFEWLGATSGPWRPDVLFPAPYARPFPSLLGFDDRRWLEHGAPPDETVIRLIDELKRFLGAQGFQWLCACAAHGELAWHLTLNLSGALFATEEEANAALPALVRLPWLRHGYMPDWLRRRLLAEVPAERRAVIRARINELIESSGPAGATGADAIRIATEGGDVMQEDRVFVDFMEDEAQELDIPAPENVAKLDRRRTRSVENAPAWLRRWAGAWLDRPDWTRSLTALGCGLVAGLALVVLGEATVLSTPREFVSAPGTGISALAFSPDGQYFVEAHGEAADRPVLRAWEWNASRLTLDASGMRERSMSSEVTSLAFRPATPVVVALTRSLSNAELIDLSASNQQVVMETVLGATVAAYVTVAGGERLAFAGSAPVIQIAEKFGGKAIALLTSHAGGTTDLASSPAGNLLASAGSDLRLQLHDLSSVPRTVAVLSGLASVPLAVAFSPDGKLLASGHDDGSVVLWDAERREHKGEPLKGHRSRVNAVAFSADGKLLASAGNDNRVIVWDVAQRKEMTYRRALHTADVRTLAFSADGATLATGTADGAIRLWRMHGHTVELPPTQKPAPVQQTLPKPAPDDKKQTPPVDSLTIQVIDPMPGTAVDSANLPNIRVEGRYVLASVDRATLGVEPVFYPESAGGCLSDPQKGRRLETRSIPIARGTGPVKTEISLSRLASSLPRDPLGYIELNPMLDGKPLTPRLEGGVARYAGSLCYPMRPSQAAADSKVPDEVNRFFGLRRSPQVMNDNVARSRSLAKALAAAGVGDRDLLAMALAIVKWDVGDFRPREEQPNSSNTSSNGKPFDLYDNRFDNQDPGDGQRYRGRGYFLALVGRREYKAASDLNGIDLLGKPELALDPAIAERILVGFVRTTDTELRQIIATRNFSIIEKKMLEEKNQKRSPGLEKAFRDAQPLAQALIDEAKGGASKSQPQREIQQRKGPAQAQ